jgi:hypothetical protein
MEVKRQEREADHSPSSSSSSSDVKNDGTTSVPPLPHMTSQYSA